MKKIVSIVGARPNFIKLSALCPLLEKNFNHIIVHTGQHYDYGLSKSLFLELHIKKPNYNLLVRSGTHAAQTATILLRAEKVIKDEKPDLVIVYGDTNSTLGGALVASKLNIPVAHVEAGERCGNLTVAEEVNRIVVDHISDLLFASSQEGLKNLKKENLENAFFTGDLMIDSAKQTHINANQILKTFNLNNKKYLYATLHRAENTTGPEVIKMIINILNDIGYKIILSLHPRTAKVLKDTKISTADFQNIIFVKPQPYKNSLALIKSAKFVITDSGGIQKEAFHFKTPCVVLRGEIEQKELVKSGWTYLVNPRKDLNYLKNIIEKFSPPNSHPNFYGRGTASKVIIGLIKSYFKHES